MPTPSRGAATNRPDTSNANVARVLREAADQIFAGTGTQFSVGRECERLADALEQTNVSDTALLGALTERLDRALIALREPCTPTDRADARLLIDRALKSLPELAPSDD